MDRVIAHKGIQDEDHEWGTCGLHIGRIVFSKSTCDVNEEKRDKYLIEALSDAGWELWLEGGCTQMLPTGKASRWCWLGEDLFCLMTSRHYALLENHAQRGFLLPNILAPSPFTSWTLQWRDSLKTVLIAGIFSSSWSMKKSILSLIMLSEYVQTFNILCQVSGWQASLHGYGWTYIH